MLDETRVVELLRTTEIFSQFQEKHLSAIAKACKVTKFEERARIVSQGEAGGELYIIASGEVSVVLEDKDLGIEQPVLKLRPGQSFGEVSLLAQAPRSATVKATTETVCVALAKASFESVLRQIPEVGIGISRYLAARLHHQCQLTGFRFVSLGDLVHDPELYSLFPQGLLARVKAVPLELKDGTLTVAFTKPNEVSSIVALREALPGLAIEPVACTSEDYEIYKERFSELQQDRLPTLGPSEGEQRFQLESGQELAEPLQALLQAILYRKLNRITIQALSQKCVVADPAASTLKPLLLIEDPAQREHLLHQLTGLFTDGQSVITHTLLLGQYPCTLQASCLQTLEGPRYALRLVDQKGSIPSLSALMPYEPLKNRLLQGLRARGGAVLLAGAPRTGRTTTAYSLLRAVAEDFGLDNVITLEKKPPAKLGVVSQVQAGQGWQNLIEAALLQVPSLLFVDDVELPELANLLGKCEGGHTTFACFDSDEPLKALMSILTAEEPGSAVDLSNLALLCHQKSFPRQCPHCREECQPSGAVLSRLSRENLVEPGQIFFRSAGCDKCRDTGSLGRCSVFELTEFNPFLREMMQAKRPLDALRKAAKDNGLFMPFQVCAKVLLKQGDLAATDALRYFGRALSTS